MVRPIVRDMLFLSHPSIPAAKGDEGVFDDLLDTLRANQERCVGLAANMIGVQKRIIAFASGPFQVGMMNPEIIRKLNPYEAEEGCLSLDGIRKTIRYEKIEVAYQDRSFQKRKATYTGWIAQIIQHEVDHLNGILI